MLLLVEDKPSSILTIIYEIKAHQILADLKVGKSHLREKVRRNLEVSSVLSGSFGLLEIYELRPVLHINYGNNFGANSVMLSITKNMEEKTNTSSTIFKRTLAIWM